jgi:uncharacterized protein (TIGR02300 family)
MLRVSKDERGTKRTDPDTGKKFYDLNQDPIVSPYTGKSYPRSFFEQAVFAKASPARAVDDEDETEEEEVEDAAAPEVISLEEADAEEGAEDDLAKMWRQCVRFLVSDVPQRLHVDVARRDDGPYEMVDLAIRYPDRVMRTVLQGPTIDPYRRSWSSGALARAQSIGVPAIVTAVGGLAEQAGPGDVVIEDDAGLARAMAEISSDRARAMRR